MQTILALAVAIASLAILTTFLLFPKAHRKEDFALGGGGLLYALILWACAGRITGAVLLGQMAAIALLGWFGWETITLRKQVSSLAQQLPVAEPGIEAATGSSASGTPSSNATAEEKAPEAEVASEMPEPTVSEEEAVAGAPFTEAIDTSEPTASPPTTDIQSSETSVQPPEEETEAAADKPTTDKSTTKSPLVALFAAIVNGISKIFDRQPSKASRASGALEPSASSEIAEPMEREDEEVALETTDREVDAIASEPLEGGPTEEGEAEDSTLERDEIASVRDATSVREVGDDAIAPPPAQPLEEPEKSDS